MLTKFASIGSYSPKVRTFGTLITSTKVFSLIIICKVFDKTILYLEILDDVPRDLTILYLEIVDSIHKQVIVRQHSPQYQTYRAFFDKSTKIGTHGDYSQMYPR